MDIRHLNHLDIFGVDAKQVGAVSVHGDPIHAGKNFLWFDQFARPSGTIRPA